MKTDLQRAKIITQAISPWLYSQGAPPESLNRLFLDWIENNKVASMAEIRKALREAKGG